MTKSLSGSPVIKTATWLPEKWFVASMTVPALLLSAFALLASLIVAATWIAHNPFVSGWDQIQYIDLAIHDGLVRRLDGNGALRDSLFGEYRWMPPGVRLLAMPLVWFGHDSETAFRWFTMTLFVGSLAVLYDAARRMSGSVAAAGSVALMVVCPVWIRASEDFMSETALIPVVAVLLWCVVRESEARTPRYVPVLSGLALGFGLLARFSFAPMGVVVLAMLTLRAWQRRRWTGLVISLLTMAIIAWPFYAYNGVRYLAYGRFAATWPLDQLGGHHLAYAANYLMLLSDTLGLPVVLILPVMVFVTVRHWILPADTIPGAPAVVSTCRFVGFGCGLILLLMLLPHILGHNQNPRYLLGALPVLVIFLASGCRLRGGLAMAGVAGVQATMLLAVLLMPSQADMSRQATDLNLSSVSWRANPTCDWSSVVHAVAPLSARPVVRFFGITDAVNHVQIQLPFLRAGILANVIPADLSKADAVDLTRSPTDAILILNDNRLPWPHPDVPDPNIRIAAIRDAMLRDPGFVLSPVHVGGPAAECGMSLFLAKGSR